MSGIHAELMDAMATHARSVERVGLATDQMKRVIRPNASASAGLIGQLTNDHRNACIECVYAADGVLDILASMGAIERG